MSAALPMRTPEFISVREAARRLGRSHYAVLTLAAAGEIVTRQSNNGPLVELASLNAYFVRHPSASPLPPVA